MLPIEERAAKLGRSVESFERRRQHDLERWSTIRIYTEIYEEVKELADKTNTPGAQIFSQLVDYALDHVKLVSIPVYRYELGFDADEEEPAEEQAPSRTPRRRMSDK